MKKHFKLFLVFLSFALFIKVFGDSSHLFFAEAADPGCSAAELLYEPCKEWGPLNVKRTECNVTRSMLVNRLNDTTGADIDQVMMCQDYIQERMSSVAPDDGTLPDDYATCHVDGSERAVYDELCGALSSDVGPVQQYRVDVSNGKRERSVALDSINGSLIGFGTMLDGAALREPVPVNFAYYWNRGVEKIPFAGKALAADTEAYENLPILKSVYEIWELTLKVALGLLSLVLLYTGIMITMGKKISTQAVVSVQYAIPKIVIGTMLIIFSYPIGAVITSISFGLYRGAAPMFFNLIGLNLPDGNGFLMLSLMWQTLAMARGGVAFFIIGLLTVLILSIAKIILTLKVLMIYIKMVFSIVAAPLEFVLGTIPGNDDKIKDWFLRMAKYGITIFGMGIVVPASLWVALKVYAAYRLGGSSEAGGWGVAISLIAPLIIAIFGFSLGMGMEKKVDEMFFGKKKR
ncbi:MAG TPA: hypothetical protein PLX95_01440 [bacterium]|nr:hypothetical protein [bacterium]